jgi:hypothetical protein
MCTSISRALKLMATRQQIRPETKHGLLSLNDTNVHGVDFHNVEVQQRGILRTI